MKIGADDEGRHEACRSKQKTALLRYNRRVVGFSAGMPICLQDNSHTSLIQYRLGVFLCRFPLRRCARA
jgi:hypothetical protein